MTPTTTVSGSSNTSGGGRVARVVASVPTTVLAEAITVVEAQPVLPEVLVDADAAKLTVFNERKTDGAEVEAEVEVWASMESRVRGRWKINRKLRARQMHFSRRRDAATMYLTNPPCLPMNHLWMLENHRVRRPCASLFSHLSTPYTSH